MNEQEMDQGKTNNYITFLESIEATQFDIAEAIYWFCSDNHEGQFSKKYEILCHCGFKPSPLSKGPEEMAQMIYDNLLEDGIINVEDLYTWYCKKYNHRS